MTLQSYPVISCFLGKIPEELRTVVLLSLAHDSHQQRRKKNRKIALARISLASLSSGNTPLLVTAMR
jgi:hypothetical protein